MNKFQLHHRARERLPLRGQRTPNPDFDFDFDFDFDASMSPD
ncbi:MAG: hypothetical protein ACOX52_16450 [Verrucomicrobiota bacterium]